MDTTTSSASSTSARSQAVQAAREALQGISPPSGLPSLALPRQNLKKGSEIRQVSDIYRQEKTELYAWLDREEEHVELQTERRAHRATVSATLIYAYHKPDLCT